MAHYIITVVVVILRMALASLLVITDSPLLQMNEK